MFISAKITTLTGKDMVSIAKIFKAILNVNNVVIDNIELAVTDNGVKVLKIDLHPTKAHANRCPHCGKRYPVYDRSLTKRKWRALDFGGMVVELYYATQRVCCKEHRVVVASVPWAFHDSGFTKDFDLQATYIALNINKSVAASYMRCDWKTIMRCISRARAYLEPNIDDRLNNLVNIGIDETSYRKGHNYVTVVVNHDTNTVVWVGEGHSTETLSKFFEKLTPEQRASIKRVSGDGAKWIDACLKKYCPNAIRCVDAFHVVTWAMEALDSLRKELWHDAFDKFNEYKEELKPKRGKPSKENQANVDKLNSLKEKAKAIKGSTYALGKAPENLTVNQKDKLDFIADTHPKLFRGYILKEQLRLIFKLNNVDDAKEGLKHFFWRATHSRIQIFKELAYKIKRHEKNILNTIEQELSNARIESINNKIKLVIRKAYGFRNIQNMIDMILLACSEIKIPLPNRGIKQWKIA